MRSFLKSIFFLSFICFCFFARASHNRAGEITYKWLFGYTYEIVITTYTNTYNTNADRCYDTLYFGDGTSEAVPRINGITGNLCSPGVGDGVMIDTWIKLNIYKTTHTFPGPNCYLLTMADPNRNAGVQNIPNSSSVPFFIKSELCIGSFSGPNSSPILTNPPIDDACVGNCFVHNAGAFDIDGDSLSYELATCLGAQGLPVFGYIIPSGVSIDPVTGDFLWCSPTLQGEYNFAFIIREWRKNMDGVYSQVGYVLRDMQVTVGACNNVPPSLQNLNDTCIEAGTTLVIPVSASDQDITQTLTLTSYGGPYTLSNSPSSFVSTPSQTPVNGVFTWSTNCQHVRLQPYMVTFKVEDNDNMIPLVDFETFFITIVAPGPTNVTAQPNGTSMVLTWNNGTCNGSTGNYIYKYLIYRIDSCINWQHSACERGVPSWLGMTLIGYTNGLNDTAFIDNNNGLGLVHGTNYSYVVVGLYGDGAQTYASTPVCNHLLRDVPVITNADVIKTSNSSGEINVIWVKPIVEASNPDKLDTLANPGPYEFRLLQSSGFNTVFTPIYSVIKPYFANLNSSPDTSYTSQLLNTVSGPYTYRVDFYCNGTLKGSTQTASSTFLTAQASDNEVQLQWNFVTPWTNFKFYIYREISPGSSSWVLIDSTSQKFYIDSGLINGQQYCYKILCKGKYSDTSIVSPLLNNSEEVCATPVDQEPPCQPEMNVEGSCLSSSVIITWKNPNNYCSDDAVMYKIYFQSSEDNTLKILDSTTNINDTVYVFDGENSIAGCFAVTAIDSFGNESIILNKFCTDNCPEYELPNIITLNGDGINDFFIPVKNKYIKSVELKIYDRWGTLVFETENPAVNWDGKNIKNSLNCVNGTYFYTCTVNEIWLSGIKSRDIKGWLQIIDK
ncbi:MAG: gliding motility-associated C-terminal domain-containing protein [Bacteroidota bacterium]|jgi:gliding motility-associated-like protein